MKVTYKMVEGVVNELNAKAGFPRYVLNKEIYRDGREVYNYALYDNYTHTEDVCKTLWEVLDLLGS
jgi:hypothetical protein